jgi:hypothetical protein
MPLQLRITIKLIPLKHCHLVALIPAGLKDQNIQITVLAMIAGKGIADHSLRKPCILLLDVYRSKIQ